MDEKMMTEDRRFDQWLSLWHLALSGLFVCAIIIMWALQSISFGLSLLGLCVSALFGSIWLLWKPNHLTPVVLVMWGLGVLWALIRSGGIESPLLIFTLMPVMVSWAYMRPFDIKWGAIISIFVLISVCVASFMPASWGLLAPPRLSGLLGLCALIIFILAFISLAHQLSVIIEARHKRLKAQSARYQLFLTEQPGLILAFEPKGLVTAAFGTAPSFLNPQELLSKGLMSIVGSDDREAVLEALFFAMKQGTARVKFSPIGALDRYLSLSVRKGSNDQLIGILWESTLEHARIEVLETRFREQEQVLDNRTNAMATLSHELRTPLNAVLGFADLMHQELFGPLPEKYKDYSALIREAGDHMLDLLNDVLDQARIAAKNYQLTLSQFDARVPISEALRLLRPLSQERKIKLRGLMSAKPVMIDADRRALKQIMLNLLSNALKFTPEGGLIDVRLKGFDTHIELTVRDTGIGMNSALLAKLGMPFVKGGEEEAPQLHKNKASGSGSGFGLGLSIVSSLITLHGGDMTFHSAEAKGTIVKIRLPLKSLGQTSLPLPEPTAK